MKQIEYQSYNQPRGGFNPNQLGDNTVGMAANAARVQQSQQNNINQLIANQKIEMANLEETFKTADAFKDFSKTALNIASQIAKEKLEDQVIEDKYQAIFGGDYTPSPEEEQVERDREQITVDNSTTATQLEQGGNPGAGNYVRNQTGTGAIAQDYRSERQRIFRARTAYPMFIAAYVQDPNKTVTINGTKMPITQAIRSGDAALVSAAMAQARGDFLRSFGLQNASKRNLVKGLGGVVTNTETQLATGFLNQSLKDRNEAAQAEINSSAYTAGLSGAPGTLGQSFQDLSLQAWTSGAFTSRTDANRAVVEGMLKGAIARGDVAAIDELAGELQVPNQSGTELGRVYAPLFDEARANAKQTFESNLTQANKDIRAEMFKDLAGATNQQQRDQIIESAAEKLEAQGDYEGARKLRQQRDDLVVEGSADYNAAQLERQVRTGGVTSANQIDEQVLLGNITQQDGERLKKLLTTSRGAADPKDATAKSVADDWKDRATSAVLTKLGLKKDQFGRIDFNSKGVITAGEAEVIKGQIERDINLVVNQVLETNPGLLNNPIELQRVLAKELKDWQVQNLGKDGKYDITERPDTPEGKSTLSQRFKNLAASPGVLSRPSIPRGSRSRPVDFTTSRNRAPDGTILPSTRQNFNPLRGDKVLPEVEVEAFSNDFLVGKIPPDLQKAAEGLGMSPLALLQQQRTAYGLPPINPSSIAPTTGRGSEAPASSYEGAQALMTRGFPLKGAAWLAGNIQQESGWNAGRPSWDDGGAQSGGLVSWRAARLQAIEARYGRPIQNITMKEQLDYMVEELGKFPEANRIFRNPNATERQLIRASKQFWGYGEEGKRYSYARQTERQLRSQPSTAPTLSGNGKQRTLAVGKQLLQQGYVIWQHPNFDADRGFVPEGGARVATRSYDSPHHHAEALDFPVGDNGAARLDQLAALLRKNKQAWGIKSILWRTADHHDHLHVEFYK